MTLYLVAFAVMLLSFLGLAVGVLMGRDPIKGSCGGLGSGACAGCRKVCRRHHGSAESEEEA